MFFVTAFFPESRFFKEKLSSNPEIDLGNWAVEPTDSHTHYRVSTIKCPIHPFSPVSLHLPPSLPHPLMLPI